MTMTFDGADRLLTILQGANLTTVSFDANGNQTGENLNGALTTNTFDQENRLIGVVQADGTRSTNAPSRRNWRVGGNEGATNGCDGAESD